MPPFHLPDGRTFFVAIMRSSVFWNRPTVLAVFHQTDAPKALGTPLARHALIPLDSGRFTLTMQPDAGTCWYTLQPSSFASAREKLTIQQTGQLMEGDRVLFTQQLRMDWRKSLDCFSGAYSTDEGRDSGVAFVTKLHLPKGLTLHQFYSKPAVQGEVKRLQEILHTEYRPSVLRAA